METWRHYYNIVYKISSLTGTWPYLKPRARIFRVVVITITMVTVLVPQFAYQFTCKTNVQCICEAMTSYLLTFTSLLKVYTCQLNTRTIKNLTQHLFIDWKGLKTSEEYEIMKLYAENSRRFCVMYTVYCMLAVTTFMSLSLVPFALDAVWPLNESRPIIPPYPGYYFVELREYFYKIFWHSIIAWEITIVGIVAHDCMFVTFVEHVCSMFALVGFYFENLFNKDDKTMKIANNSNDTYRERITLFINKHQDALKFVEHIENIFTIPFGAQMIIVTIGLSITLLQLTQQNGDILISIKYVLYVLGQLFHLFCLCFEGQKLIEHSIQTCDKIYSSTWYEVSMRSQKLIVMVMMKSVRPSFLSAGKIYIFSLESFTTVIKAKLSCTCYI
ncbi:Putative odorant receptor 22c [Trachymyrmex cornetzi]|uniref:Odorant receptor n=1 Tax=Trachymyrmex cornetzi TaxID=471704 RepID=A0A151JBP1_9HYME|nr:Putative odorant receptor 22c [Trachymyrmex cornetzi]